MVDLNKNGQDDVTEVVKKTSEMINRAGDASSDPYKQTKTEFARIFFFLLIALLTAIPLPYETLGLVILIGQVSLICLATHLFRKFLMSYVRLEDVYKKAIESPIGAGMVFIGVALLLCVLIHEISQLQIPASNTGSTLSSQNEKESVQP